MERRHMPLERGARAEGDDRHLVLCTKLDDLRHLRRRLGEDHGIWRRRRVVALVLAVLLPHRRRRRYPLTETLAQPTDYIARLIGPPRQGLDHCFLLHMKSARNSRFRIFPLAFRGSGSSRKTMRTGTLKAARRAATWRRSDASSTAAPGFTCTTAATSSPSTRRGMPMTAASMIAAWL